MHRRRARAVEAVGVRRARMREQRACRSRTGSTIWPACRWPARIRCQRPGSARGRAPSGSDRAGSAGRRPSRRSRCARLASHERGSTPASSHAAAAQLDLVGRVVEQQRPVLEPAELDRPRERVARDREVVVAEHDVRMRRAASSSSSSCGSPPRPREQVARRRRRGRAGAPRPTRPRARPRARRATARRGGSRTGARCAARRARAAGPAASSSSTRRRTQPASNQPQADRSPPRAPRRPRRRRRASDLELLEDRLDRDDVPLELQLRLLEARRRRRSAARGAGSASRSRVPVVAFSFDCHASSERWQSGHGVTIASAPASIACSIGWISSPSAVSSRAWMIGKPQHLIFAG